MIKLSEIKEYNTGYLIEVLAVLESRLQGATPSTKRSLVNKCSEISSEINARFIKMSHSENP